MDIENKDDVADLVRLLRYMPKSHESAAADLIEKLLAEREQLLAQMPLTTIQVLQGYPSIVSHSQCGVKDGIYKVYAHAVPAQQVQPSPAVAVPDELIKWLQNFEKMTYNSGFLWMAKDAKRFLEIIQSQKVNRESIALILLGKIFDLYENGVDCYEDPDQMSNYVGKAFELDDETFDACVNILNGNPADPSPRITEQDAREQEPIYQAKSVGGLWLDVTKETVDSHEVCRRVYAAPVPAMPMQDDSDLSYHLERVRKWGIENTGNEPSVSCFHRAVDELSDFIKAMPIPKQEPVFMAREDLSGAVSMDTLACGSAESASIYTIPLYLDCATQEETVEILVAKRDRLKAELEAMRQARKSYDPVPAMPIPKQEPAGAVPDYDEMDALINDLRDHIAQPPHLSSKEFIKGCLHALDTLKCRTKTKRALLSTSPRITEQDAREMAGKLEHVLKMNRDVMTNTGVIYVMNCIALLNKLNAKPERD